MAFEKSETRNVLVSALIIGAVIIFVSIGVLYLLTNNIYLDAYYTIETFFDNPNTASSFNLATMAFGYGIYKFSLIVLIVILDNLSKILVISFVLAAVLDIIGYANLEEVLNKMKAKSMRGHVIICGYNELSANLIDRLRKKGIKFVVIENKQETTVELDKEKIVAITGKFTEKENLENAGIENASAVVFASWDDLENLLGAVTAKKIKAGIKILTRVSSDEISIKMHRLGVEMCVLPEYLAGIELGEELMRVVSRG